MLLCMRTILKGVHLSEIEIENPGILLPGMIIEDVKQGVSRIRNRVIARVFRELDLIEQWGSGFRRILKDAEELRLPQPEIIEIGMRARFIVNLAESIELPAESYLVKEGPGSWQSVINCIWCRCWIGSNKLWRDAE